MPDDITSNPAPSERHRVELDLLVRGFQVSRMLRLVADLELADKIAPNAAMPVAALATACGVLGEPLIRVLRALAAFQVFAVSTDGRVSHTPLSRLLRTDTVNSMHHAARFSTGPGSWKAWGELDAAMTGGNPHEAAWNMSRFAYLRQHPDEAQAFNARMANFPDHRHTAFAKSYDFSGARVIADIGGGNGAALRQILAHTPGPRGLLVDQKGVVANLSPADLADGRITAVSGDFFEAVPRGADVYLLIRVLHDWNDADCVRILKACRAAMTPDARLLLGEQLLESDPTRGKPTEYLIDTHMMAMFGQARERTQSEFRGLLAQAGFTLRRTVETGASVAIVEATPVAVIQAAAPRRRGAFFVETRRDRAGVVQPVKSAPEPPPSHPTSRPPLPFARSNAAPH